MATRRRSTQPRSRRGATPAGGGPATGCNWSLKWSLLTSTSGMTPVWIPNETYQKIARAFLKSRRGKYERKLLRARMAPVGILSTCGGTCGGGWCKEIVITPDVNSAVSVCECAYFV